MASPKVSLPADKKAALTTMLQNMPTSGGKDEVQGYLVNTTKGTLVHCETKSWIGNSNFPPTVLGGDNSVKFSSELPSKVGVIYKGWNDSGDECKWLLAFSAPGTDDDSAKVYVEAGEMTDVDWDAVETLLDDRGNASYYQDYDSGCIASAAIEAGYYTKVVCNFNDS